MKRQISFFFTLFFATVIAAQDFSVSSQLKEHICSLCSDEMEGRKAGTSGEKQAAAYLFDCLENAGVVMLTNRNGQDFIISQDDGDINSQNIVGIVEGYDSTLKNEYIVVGAHYDGLGMNSVRINGKEESQLFEGAYGNASGTSLLIELARLVAANSFLFPRSIIFVGFGAGECGHAGSWYFANRAFEDIGSVKAMIDLDMLGRENSRNALQIFSQCPSEELDHLMNLTGNEPVVSVPVKASGTIFSSDYLSFYEKNIPVFLFTTGMTSDYHSLRDRQELLQTDALERELNYVFYFLKQLSGQEKMPRVGEIQKSADESRIYDVREVDERPQFFHSDEQHFLDSWVYKYVKYPNRAVVNGIQGRVIVSFVIEKDGTVSNVNVERSVDEDLDAEAVKVVSISPRWIPGRIKGEKVRVRVSIPIEFRLK